MKKPTRWAWVWLVALAIIVSGELFTVVDPKTGDTISENVQLLTLARNPWLRWSVRGLVLVFCAWLGVHLSFGVLP